MSGAVELWGGHLPVGQRTPVTRPIREAIATLADQALALRDAADYEGLAAGGQDLEAVTDDLMALIRDVKVYVAEIVDEMERQARADDAERRAAEGKKPLKRNDLDAPLGPVRVEVEGVGAVEVNGGWDRKNWQSERLLRDMLDRFLTNWHVVDGEGELIYHEQAVNDLHTFLVEIMPVTGSMQWRVGKADGSNGLRALGVDETDYCERTEKPRLARWPRRQEAVQ